jgi:hypothetical protein
MTILRSELRAIVRDVSFSGAGAARVGGVEMAVAGPAGPSAGLSEALYARHYTRAAESAPAAPDPTGFLETLRAANRLPARWEAWTVAGADPHGLLLTNERGMRRRATYSEAVPGAGGLAAGQPVHVPAAREALTAPQGHYAVFGRTVADARAGRQVRFYWNIEAEAAAPFLDSITTGLERRRIPFQAKVPAVPAGYARADGGVLYLDSEDVEASLDILAAVQAGLAAWLRPPTPLFARQLGRGVAFAESPPTGESFGMHRCRLVAEGLVQAFAAGATDDEARVEAILARFVGYGLDPEAPERNPATRYPYRFDGVFAA